MPYQGPDIDRAIVMTQYDLRGFAHPTGIRIPSPNSKTLFLVLINLFSFIRADGKQVQEDDRSHVTSQERQASYARVRQMCEQIYADCRDESRREAIWLIARTIRRQHQFLSKKKRRDKYLLPLTKTSWWGKRLLALEEVFKPSKKEE